MDNLQTTEQMPHLVYLNTSWRRGMEVLAFISKSKDPGFESRPVSLVETIP
jgi:hypothetical protein